MQYPIDVACAVDSVFGYIPKGSTFRLGKRLAGPTGKNRSLMSLVIESITTDKDRLEAQQPKKKKVEVEEVTSQKNTDQDWEKLHAEIKEMIEKSTELNTSSRDMKTYESVSGVDKYAKIYQRRGELFSIMYKLPSSHEKRDALALLHKLKDMDDNDFVMNAMNGVDLQMRMTNTTVIEPKFIHNDKDLVEVLTADTTPPDGCADNYWLAYSMAFIAMELSPVKDSPFKETTKKTAEETSELFVEPAPEFTKPKLSRRAPSKPTHLFYKSKFASAHL